VDTDNLEQPDRFTRSVVSAFFKDGKLVQIPAKRSKRIVVLERILAEFGNKDAYHEREVNDIIRRFHDDVCTIRREFIMNRYMTRKDGFYRLTEKGRRAVA
jgi:hypothetical protein